MSEDVDVDLENYSTVNRHRAITQIDISALVTALVKLLSYFPLYAHSLPAFFNDHCHCPLPAFFFLLVRNYEQLFFTMFDFEDILILNALEAVDVYRNRYVLLIILAIVIELYERSLNVEGIMDKDNQQGGLEEMFATLFQQKSWKLASCFNSLESWMISSHHSLTILSVLNSIAPFTAATNYFPLNPHE